MSNVTYCHYEFLLEYLFGSSLHKIDPFSTNTCQIAAIFTSTLIRLYRKSIGVCTVITDYVTTTTTWPYLAKKITFSTHSPSILLRHPVFLHFHWSDGIGKGLALVLWQYMIRRFRQVELCEDTNNSIHFSRKSKLFTYFSLNSGPKVNVLSSTYLLQCTAYHVN